MVYFDAVIDHSNMPIFNSTPENVKKYLEDRSDEENAAVHVFEGKTMLWFQVKEYLAR